MEMMDLSRISVFLLVSIFLAHVCGAKDDLKKNVNSLAEVFRRHDNNFLYNLKPLIPNILSISRAQLHVRQGSLTVTSDIQEDFKTLEKELAQYSVAFRQLIDKVELPENIISFRQCIETMNEVLAKRRRYLDANETNVKEMASEFIKDFEDRLILASDILYVTLHNDISPDKQLFEQLASATHQHPFQTMEFMHGCFQILTQLTMMEVNHVEMSLVKDEATEAYERNAIRRMTDILEVALKIDARLRSYSQMEKQIGKDQKRFHEEWQSLNHCDFASKAKAYFEEKYSKHNFLVISYDDTHSVDRHIIVTCRRTFMLFSNAGRNSIIITFSADVDTRRFSQMAETLLEMVPESIRIKHNAALEVSDVIRSKFEWPCQLEAVFVVKKYINVCFDGPQDYAIETFRTAEKCNTKLCWIKNKYPVRVIVVG